MRNAGAQIRRACIKNHFCCSSRRKEAQISPAFRINQSLVTSARLGKQGRTNLRFVNADQPGRLVDTGRAIRYHHSMKRRTFFKTTLAAVAFTVSGASLALRAAAAGFWSKVLPRRRTIVLPPLPRWSKTTDDIDTADFRRRSQDYERSLLPPNRTFPRTGQIWEAVRDCEVYFMAWVPKTIIPGGRARFQRGERVRILPLDDPKPIQVRFQPVRYHQLQEYIVPLYIRDWPGYQYYVLSLRTARTACCLQDEPGFFHELFKLVEDVP